MANCEAWETHLKGRPNDANAKWRRNDLIRHIRCRLGIKAVVEQARCAFLRKRGIGVEPIDGAGSQTGITNVQIGQTAGDAIGASLKYLSGEQSSEEVWRFVCGFAQCVARMIADREGRSCPPAAVKMMIPGCEINRAPAIAKEIA
ncbi:hypothetical protein [Komagataeibacter intermedius]|uniref:hypothetical protein n=1 Tax=Komagataeibacter intermedius TaxID=66229 RepID=UPI003B43A2C4